MFIDLLIWCDALLAWRCVKLYLSGLLNCIPPPLKLAMFPYIHKGCDKKKKQPFLRLGIARYFFDACLCLQTNFPKAKVLLEKTETISLQVVFHGFTRGGGQFIARHWQKEKWVCVSTQLYTFDGVENVKGLDCEYSSRGHTRSNVFVCLADWLVDINFLVLSSVVHLVLGRSPSPSLFKVPSSFRAGIVCGRWKCLYLTQIIGMSFLTASILQTIPRPRNGNKPLAETSDKGRTISHCMCVNMHLWVLCVCACMFVYVSLSMQAYMQVPICVHLSACDGVPQILSG